MGKIEESVCDYFIITDGDSKPQVKAIMEEIAKMVKSSTGEGPWKKEGIENLEWVILDYFNIVVHVFIKDKRPFYNIEELWSDAKMTVYA